MQMNTVWVGPAKLGECPVWHPESGCLYWVDCVQGRIYQHTPMHSQVDYWQMPAGVGCVAPAVNNNLISFMGGEIILIDAATGAYKSLQKVFSPDSGFRGNDGKCDRQGRFWCGTVSKDFSTPTGCLYCYDPKDGLRLKQEGLFISNGLGWSPDDKYFYHSDSWVGKIYRYNYDASTGNITNREEWFVYPGLGVADGLTVDVNGNIWTAVWDGAKVLCINPDGKVIDEILMPVKRPTSCIFGGDDLKTLYVTSCSADVAETIPLPAPNGSVYAIDGVSQGIAEGVFES